MAIDEEAYWDISSWWDFENGWKRIIFQGYAICSNCGAKLMNGKPIAETYMVCDSDYTITEEYRKIAQKTAYTIRDSGINTCEKCGAVMIGFRRDGELIK